MEDRPAQSKEYVRVSVLAVNENGAAVNPTVDSVALAFIAEGDPVVASSTFIAGTWETDVSDAASPIYYGRVLAGPGAAYIPVAGTNVDVYIKVSDNPEVPIVKAGTMRFT
jgi:hypothetical protein